MVVNADPHLRVQGATVTTGDLVESAAMTAPDVGQTFGLLVRIIRNIVDYPHDPKFQELRKSNATFVEALAQSAPCTQLLRRLGFREQGEVFRLQPSGLRPSEVARLQAALHEFPEFSALVRDLGPAVKAVGLNWSEPNGTSTFIPFYEVIPRRTSDLRAAAEEEDAELQEALRLSSQGAAPCGGGGSRGGGSSSHPKMSAAAAASESFGTLGGAEDADLQEALRLSLVNT
mmetsp:Transcript_126651/g.405512  ORF Transcript_126651/g.405512 Transcript_126651/m.405512 type:complete len:231 (+) Transcript_126651:85-777(+)|eukprot:CAMPEP_0203968042 /NCGR_PEP_ID=MMETSP0359-20131031/96750_1 /ASSEMBLY_ACC=CAM_ASM_000338 /TAXON_ID=268821 /ORGANISM="Scrippsiella Hangoei, Strain SHTV-5" /LENGTH=230 /DNA_ID=CAMNT_0050905963 /DNA_START=67 /DNA_END=759 /DNA_ORIENTATION=+